jgi:hypothetical protein
MQKQSPAGKPNFTEAEKAIIYSYVPKIMAAYRAAYRIKARAKKAGLDGDKLFVAAMEIASGGAYQEYSEQQAR